MDLSVATGLKPALNFNAIQNLYQIYFNYRMKLKVFKKVLNSLE